MVEKRKDLSYLLEQELEDDTLDSLMQEDNLTLESEQGSFRVPPTFTFTGFKKSLVDEIEDDEIVLEDLSKPTKSESTDVDNVIPFTQKVAPKKFIKDGEWKHADELPFWRREAQAPSGSKIMDNPVSFIDKKSVKKVEKKKVSVAKIVGPNGSSLEEYLLKKRASKRKLDKEDLRSKIDEALLTGESEEVRKQFFRSDERLAKKKRRQSRYKDRYVTIELEDLPKAMNEPSKWESQLCQTLGITLEQLRHLVSEKSGLTDVDKARLLSSGWYGFEFLKERTEKFRNTLNEGDMPVIEFILEFKACTVRQLSLALGKSESAIYGRLQRMYRKGLVNKYAIIQGPTIWTLTGTCLVLLRNADLETWKYKEFKFKNPSGLAERMIVNYVAACIWGSQINILNLSKSEFENGQRMTILGELVKGYRVFSESRLQSTFSLLMHELKHKGEALSASFGPMEDRARWVFIHSEQLWREWEMNGSLAEESPELSNYELFILQGLENNYLIPDLVVIRPRIDKKPRHIAVEVEKNPKTVAQYVRKLQTYQKDSRVYEKVIYVTSLPKIAERIKEAAQKIGFTRYDIVPFINEDGITKVIDGWVI